MNRASKFLPAGVLGRITPVVAWALFYRSRRVALGVFGDACRLGSPQAVALLLGDLRVKATQHLAESINAAPTTRHYYHQWFASSTVPTGGDHADF